MSTLHELEARAGRDLAAYDYWAQARSAAILEWINEIDPTVVADIGCGSGYLTEAIATRGYTATGIDIDESLITVAKNRNSDAAFRVGDARDLPWSDNSVDCCIFADVIEHFADPAPILSEARRVLSPDGEVILSLPALRLLYGPHDTNQDHYDRYNRRRVRWLAERNGFDVVETEYTNVIPLVPYFLIQRVFKSDVPAASRGQSNTIVESVKRRLLDIEQYVSPPIGVTLLARLRPVTPTPTSRVLLMNYEYPPECGGGGVFTQRLNKHLQTNGHEVRLVIGDAASARQTSSVTDLIQFPIRSLPELVRSIREHDPEVINAHFSLPTAAALPVIKRATGIPYVVSIMGADVHDPTRYQRFRPVMAALNRYSVMRHADRVIAPSTDMRDRLAKGIRLKTIVIPFFIDADAFPETSYPGRHDPLRLLTVARLVPRKNIDRVLRAVARLNGVMDVEYTIVGSGSGRADLEAIRDRLGLGDVVTFRGHVPNDQIASVYREHDVFVLPSKHEGFGIVYLEALASGLPVIGATVGGQTDIITDDVGRTVTASSTEAITDAIESVAREHDRLQPNTRQRVLGRFTHEQVVPAYERVYSEVANGQ